MSLLAGGRLQADMYWFAAITLWPAKTVWPTSTELWLSITMGMGIIIVIGAVSRWNGRQYA
jgi:hypothetical protein